MQVSCFGHKACISLYQTYIRPVLVPSTNLGERGQKGSHGAVGLDGLPGVDGAPGVPGPAGMSGNDL